MAETDKALGYAEFWDERYAKSDGVRPTHEWYRSFAQLEAFFREHLFAREGARPEDEPLILHLGSGDSTLPADLAARGYRRQLCVDFSTTVIELMTERHRAIEGIEWRYMDVRDMAGVADGSVDVALDKATLDAMVYGSPWNPPQEVRDNTSRYLREVHRVLKDDGIYLYITFRQPHFMEPLLTADGLWETKLQVLRSDGGFDYFGYAMKKAGTARWPDK